MDFESVLSGEEKRQPVSYLIPAEGVMIPVPAPNHLAPFEPLSRTVARIVQDATALEITDPDRLDYAVGLMGESKKLSKQFDAKRKDVCQDASDFIDSVRGLVSRYTERLKSAEYTILTKVNQYKLKLDIERKKQEAAAQKAAADFQKKLNKEAAKAGVEAPLVPEIVIPKEKTTIKSESGTTSYEVKRWICTVMDPAAVPKEYCEPIKKLLDDAVKMGVREIPGCKIEEITETRFRT